MDVTWSIINLAMSGTPSKIAEKLQYKAFPTHYFGRFSASFFIDGEMDLQQSVFRSISTRNPSIL